MLNAAALVSGDGAELQALLDSLFFGEIPGFTLAAVIATKRDSFALTRAEGAHVPGYVVEEDIFPNGASFSLGGPITFKNGKKPAHVVQEVPLAFLMSETDAPYLTPVPFRGKPNKPMYVEYVVRRMAVLKDITYEEAAKATYENALRFFALTETEDGLRPLEEITR